MKILLIAAFAAAAEVTWEILFNGKDLTGNLCTPGTHVEMDGKLETRHCITSTSQTFHGDQWAALEIEVHGNKMISEGIFCHQSESHPVEFRKIEIQALKE